MTRPCRLYLEGNELTAWQKQGACLEKTGTFADTPEGVADFSQFLAVDRKKRFLLLVNQEAENLVFDTHPGLPRNERKQLLQARSKRLFPDTPWRCTAPAGKQQNGETPVLFMALANTPTLASWTSRLSSAGAALAGIYSLPQLLPQLLRQAMPADEFFLAISRHNRALRFSLLRHGQLCFSRLITADTPFGIAEEHRRFLEQTARQRGSTPTPALCLIGDAEWLEQTVLPNIALRITSPESNSASLFVSVSDRRWPRAQFAAPEHLQPARRQQAIRWLWRSTALAASLGLALTMERELHSRVQHQASREEKQLHESIDAEIQQINSTLAPSGLTSGQLLQLASDQRALSLHRGAFATTLHALSQVMDASPNIALDELHWQTDTALPLTTTTHHIHLGGRVTEVDSTTAQTTFQHFQAQLGKTFSTTLSRSLAPSAAEPGFKFQLQLDPSAHR
ncbi:hypothetical protein BJN45_03635 [Azonexus hydrophilus]|uniref:GspL cytoplasmic actin-ATPase-like domain-containing protein n=1 Tax=Azonexus hydrophilus TaxID=418702 RepID=A0A1R1IDN0_9RHOO|nr:hypothetical protein [Azonexus hydrophilus]OMG56712.1 hypothetical protein BJN45_03635 [Azonexus hydrophilus]